MIKYMEIITKDYLRRKDPFGDGIFCDCDIPIYEEFVLGLEYISDYAGNNPKMGVRGITCKVSENTYRDVYIVEDEIKWHKLFEGIREQYGNKKRYKAVNIAEFSKSGRFVYVITANWAK
jgi:hypothetical protein